MRIAQVPPLYEAVPPRFYGGTERVVAHLTDALVELGHDVTLFASAEAQTQAELVKVRDQAIRLDPAVLKSDLAAHMSMLSDVRRRAADFDVIHFHTDMIHFPFFEDMPQRTLTTLHGRLDLKDLPGVYWRWKQFPLVSISDSQREPLAFANWAGTVHHGLKIAAKVDPADARYFQEKIEPLIVGEPLVEFVGEIGDEKKSAFLGGAHALLFPIDWPEPFGLVMIEAMACGTPVVAYGCGSVPEVIEDGLTGFIVSTEDEAVAALRKIPDLNRREVRRRFEERFSGVAMARRYLDLYAGLGAARPERSVALVASA